MKERLRQQAAGLGNIQDSPTFSNEVINIKKENEVTYISYANSIKSEKRKKRGLYTARKCKITYPRINSIC